MATLVLTAVGTIVGGPIGAALGGLLGQGIDRELLKPAGRQGPRLSELAVQTSSYGSAIPRLFGTLRVAGTVMWATDLIETREKHRGGKGQPSVTTYSYAAAGANLALVGDELLQFGRAEPLGGGRWRLARLLRGRRGSEWAAGVQGAGDRFVLLEAGAAATLDLPLSALNTRVRIMAQGIGDADPAEAAAIVTGESVRPPAPVGLSWEKAGGDARVRWIRRSRAGWGWTDGGDVPLGEEAEAYRVTIQSAGGPAREVVVATPELVVPAADRAAGPATVTVRQQGRAAESRPATLVVPQGREGE